MGSGLQPLRLLLQDGRMLDLTGSATMGRDSVGEVVKSESLPVSLPSSVALWECHWRGLKRKLVPF